MPPFTKLMALCVPAAFLAMSASAGQFTVESGKTEPLRLRTEAASIVIGNPNVADVSVHDGKLLFVSGKSFGTTNLMIFDKSGNTIYSANVVVTTNTANLVTVNRAGDNYTYDCAPTCRAGLSVGDSPVHYNQTYNQTQQQQELSE